MKIVSTINRTLLAGLLALSLVGAVAHPAAATVRRNGTGISSPLLGDGQETHGGPRRNGPAQGDGQETHGGPR